MPSKSGTIARHVFIDLLGSVVWFPVWWYTKGLQRVSRWCLSSLVYRSAQYGLKIWIANFFVPMYGQTDLTGRFVSVLVRFAVLVGRGAALFVEAVFYGCLVLVWVVAPPAFLLFAVTNAFQHTASPSDLFFQSYE